MKRRSLFLGWVCLLCCANAVAQPDSLRQTAPGNPWVEKVYLHTDRPQYFAGEVMRFRIFYVEGFQHTPADLSKVAYVELLSSAPAVVLQVKVKLQAAGGAGELVLPYTLTTGTYQLRAYTRWMRNESERLFFHRSLQIINPMEALPVSGKSPVVPRFLPEGGHWVADVENRVGVYLAGAANVSGVVQNQQQEVVARFSTAFDGRGSFVFMPRARDRYTVFFSLAGQPYQVPLPVPETSGMQLRVTRTGRDLHMQLLSTDLRPHQTFVLLHQSRMKSKRLVVPMENGKGVVRYPWATLPPGITRITVFGEQLQLLAERLVFKTPPAPASIAVRGSTQTNPRTKVSLSLSPVDTLQKGAAAVSVYRLDSLSGRRSSLHAYVWLESELGEEIVDGDRYLEVSDSAQHAADLLMLTSGWSRYSLPASTSTAFAPEVHGPLAEGLATDETGRAVAGLALLASARGRAQIYTTLSDRTGKFTFELPDVSGPTTLFIQNWTDPAQPLRGQWLSPFDSRISFSPARATTYPPSADLRRAFIHQQVEAAYRQPEAATTSVATPNAPFYGVATESYRLDDYTRFPTLEEVFREYIKGVWVRKNKTGFYFRQINRLNQTLMDGSNLVLLNGQPIANVNKLMEFDPLKVERIDVVDRKFFAGPVTFQGIVNVITTPQETGARIPDETVLELAYEGYQTYRERAPRVYESDSSRISRTPDFRHQLYWNANVTIGSKPTALEFFTSDVTGTFLIVVEGISNRGQCLTGAAVFNVVR